MLDFANVVSMKMSMNMSAKETQTKLKNWAPNPDITKDELAAMQVEVLDRIITARVGLLLRHPFFGNLATRLRIQACDDWCMTAATDGRNLYYNTQFFNAMDNKEIEFVIAHEILHCVFDHLTRREDRIPMLYNIAADYIVNNILVAERIGTIPKLVDCFQDFKYRDWMSEEVYDDLFEEAKKNGEEAIQQMGEMLDEHYDWENGDSDGEGGEGGEGEDGKGKSSRPTYSKEELEQIRDEMKEAMINAAQTAGAGNVPAGVARMIKDLTEPKMNWRELIRQQIQSTIKSDFTFMRPSRKSWHTGAVLPGQNFEDSIELCISIDMSGSIGDEQAKDFLSEIKGIMDEFKDYKITVWCFDTKIYNEQTFTADNGEEIADYEVIGGGGTDFMANWTYMKNEDIVPKKFIMFTDGYAWDSWGDPDYCDTIFLVHSNHDRHLEGPFGMTVHYEDHAA